MYEWILEKEAVRVGEGWNWLSIMPRGELGYQ